MNQQCESESSILPLLWGGWLCHLHSQYDFNNSPDHIQYFRNIQEIKGSSACLDVNYDKAACMRLGTDSQKKHSGLV